MKSEHGGKYELSVKIEFEKAGGHLRIVVCRFKTQGRVWVGNRDLGIISNKSVIKSSKENEKEKKAKNRTLGMPYVGNEERK